MSSLPNFDDGSGHAGTAGSSALLNFFGDRVAVYGAIGGQGAPFTAQLDGGPIQSYTENQSISDSPTENYLPNQLIYYADGLGPGKHALAFATDSSIADDAVFTIDYALVDGTVNNMLNSSGSQTNNSQPSNVLLGIVSGIAGVLAVIVMVSMVYITILRLLLNSPRYAKKSTAKAPQQEHSFDSRPPLLECS